MAKNKHILCLRFSALGDVAMAVTAVRASAAANEQVRFTFAGPERLRPLVEGCVVIAPLPNLDFIPINKKDGIRVLFRQLKRVHPTEVADLHNVQRTWILRTLFWLKGIRVVYVKKNRRSRARLVRRHHKQMHAIPPMCTQFAHTLTRLHLQAGVPVYTTCAATESRLVGLAPFAKHKGKQWPLQYVEQLIEKLVGQGYSIKLFGGGQAETDQMCGWEAKYARVEAVCNLPLADELEQMARTRVMITMDSANMHFASLLGVKVVSVWGATHPYAGFYGYGQDPAWAVQLPLPCRPCSVYGAAPCYKGTYECLTALTADRVLETVNELCRQEK